MREFVTLSITTFRGAGGEHWYGCLHVQTKERPEPGPDGGVRWILRYGAGEETHPADRTELDRVIGGKEAAYLNEKDQGGMIFRPSTRMKRGDRTTRFNDRASIEAAATAAFPTLFDDTDLLAVETEPYSEHFRPLAGPPEIVAALAAERDANAQRRLLIAAGYLRMDPEGVLEGKNDA